MFNKNVFTQKDPVADLIKNINEADYKAKMEALRGNQHKLDKNKNNKLDADDFKILRGEKKVNEEEKVEEGWDDMMKAVKDRAGPQPSGGSGVKQGSRYGGSKQKEKPEHDDEKTKKEEIDPKKVTTDTLAGRVKGKTSNQFAPTKVMMDVPDNVKEEAEQIDELDYKTLQSYRQKAHTQVQHSKFGAGKDKPDAAKTLAKREPGLEKATKRVVDAQKKNATPVKSGEMKPEYKPLGGRDEKSGRSYNEEVEQVDERTLTPGETKEKERIVKGMKKSLKGFKARYGERAKEVMYATATKAAKKD